MNIQVAVCRWQAVWQCVAHVAVMDGAFPIPPANTGFLVLPSGHTQLQTFLGLFTLFSAHTIQSSCIENGQNIQVLVEIVVK